MFFARKKERGALKISKLFVNFDNWMLQTFPPDSLTKRLNELRDTGSPCKNGNKYESR